MAVSGSHLTAPSLSARIGKAWRLDAPPGTVSQGSGAMLPLARHPASMDAERMASLRGIGRSAAVQE